MVRLRSRSSGVVVVVDAATAARLAGFDKAESAPDEKPKTQRRAPVRKKK